MNVTKLYPEGVRIDLTDDETQDLKDILSDAHNWLPALSLALIQDIENAYRNAGRYQG